MFLDLASYYQRYIQFFTHIAVPLNALTQKNVTFNWTEDCQHAFTSSRPQGIMLE